MFDLNPIVDSIIGTSVWSWMNEFQEWTIPLVQSIHILMFPIVFASILMVALRVMGLAHRSLTLRETNRRYSPWIWGALLVLLGSGILLILAEPYRELMTLSFQVKMILLVVGIVIAVVFKASVRRNEARWERDRVGRTGVRVVAASTVLLWAVIIVLGRLIAFDPAIFGCLSPYQYEQRCGTAAAGDPVDPASGAAVAPQVLN